jgi:hypothetical protein
MDPAKYWKSVMDVYNYYFFGSEAHEKYVRDRFVSKPSPKILVCVCADSAGASDDMIRSSLWHRYPVYFGHAMKELFDVSRWASVMSTDAKRVESVDMSVRYTIIGETYTNAVFGSSGTSKQTITDAATTTATTSTTSIAATATSASSNAGRDGMPCSGRASDSAAADRKRTTTDVEFRVAHTWGVNLETRDTYDYRTYVDDDGKLRAAQYARTLLQTFESIIHGCMESHTRTRTLIRMPKLGLGCYIQTLEESDRQHAHRMFMDCLHQAHANVGNSNVTIEVAAYGGMSPGCDIKDIDSDFVKVFCSGPKDDLFCKDASIWQQADTMVCLVNAWDSKSFIGNGGSRDPTIDGFMVAGIGAGKALVNTSYLHNPFLSKHVLDSKNWRKLSASA